MPIKFVSFCENFNQKELYFKQTSNLLNLCKNKLFDDFFEINEKNSEQKTAELILKTMPAFWFIVDKKTSDLLGIAYFYDFVGNSKKNHSAYFSLALFPNHKNHIGWEAFSFLTNYAFEKLKLVKIYADVFEHNQKVIKMLQRLSFVLEGYSKFKTVQNNQLIGVTTLSLINPYYLNRKEKNEYIR